MKQILEITQPCYESDVEGLLRWAADQFAGDFVTAIRYVFARPDFSDRAEVQIYSGFGYEDEARANLREQFQAGRECMGGYLMFFFDAPWTVFTFPAYEIARNAKSAKNNG